MAINAINTSFALSGQFLFYAISKLNVISGIAFKFLLVYFFYNPVHFLWTYPVIIIACVSLTILLGKKLFNPDVVVLGLKIYDKIIGILLVLGCIFVITYAGQYALSLFC